MSCAAQIEEIVASRSVRSPTSAGIKSLRSSMLNLRSGVEATQLGSASGDGDERRAGGVVNLTPCLV